MIIEHRIIGARSTASACTMPASHPWLESSRLSVATALAQGRLPHALLISGLPGIGKGVLANDLAGLLLCEHLKEDHGPCGTCRGCVQLRAGTHPDFFPVQLEIDEKTGKESSSIKIDQIRLLAEKLSLSSHQGGYKVAVINPADAMNLNAQNGLLKTLEEPSDNTVLVLISERPSQLQATVRSRCQQIRLDVPARDMALRWLEGQGLEGPLETYLLLAHGAPLAARQLAQAGTIESRREHFDSLVGILEGRKTPIAVAEVWSKDKTMQGLRWMQEWLMDLLRITMTGQTDDIRSTDLHDDLSLLARRLDSRVLFDQLERVNWTLGQSTASLNRQLQTEDILLAWAVQP